MVSEQGDAAQGEELALERDEHAVRGGERVHGEQSERGLAVDEDHVVVVAHLGQHAGEDVLAGDLVDEVHLRRGEVDVRRDDVHAGERGLDDRLVRVLQRSEHEVVDGRHVEVAHSEAGREGALRVEVDGEHLASVLGERGGQVDGGGGLAHPALLVAEGDDPGRAVAAEALRHGEYGDRTSGRTHSRRLEPGELAAR